MTLRKLINNFIKPLGIRAEPSDVFKAWEDDKVICYPKDKSNYYDSDFMAHFSRNYPDIKTSEFVISILHEVGHCYRPSKNIELNIEVYNAVSDGELPPDSYFDLSDEVAATSWAVDYIRNNADRVRAFEERLNALAGRLRPQRPDSP